MVGWEDGASVYWIRGAGFAAGGAAFWLVYFYLKDRLRPEPRRLLFAAFVLGGLSALLAVGLFRLLPLLGLPATPGVGQAAILAYCVAIVGPIEEGAKFAVARGIVFRWHAFDEPIDGVVYAAVVAIGFATVENLLYIPLLDWPHQLARALASPLTHSLFAAIWGYGVGRAFFTERGGFRRFAWQAGTLVGSMIVHGVYDYLLLARGATLTAGAIVLVLWVGLIVQCRRLVGARN